jgi:transposase
MVEDRFPRIWVADVENRDLRQLLWHRHRLVQMRTRVMNQLHVVALNEGLRRKNGLWRPAGRNKLESLKLAPWASRRRQDLLDVLDQLSPNIQELTRALEEEVEKRPVTQRLMTHPGVGPLTALAYELVTGTAERFHNGKQIASYVGLVPSEESSGDRRRGRKIAKVAMARKLAVHLYWMWRQGWDYGQFEKFGSHRGRDRRDGWVGLSF